MHCRLVTGCSARRARSMAEVQERDGKPVRHQHGFYTCKRHLDGLARRGILHVVCIMESEKRRKEEP